MRSPDYQGGGLVNLIAELEHRLTGRAVSPRLSPALAALIPEADGYLVFLFDGVGDHQLAHPAARRFAPWRVAALDAPFPTTTTVSLATVVTGSPPSRHGLLGYQLWLPEVGQVVNTIKWTTLWGDPIAYPFEELLPTPNLWERLEASAAEGVTVQPGGFTGTPLSRALYRGCRYEPVYTDTEMVEACLDLSRSPGRLVLAYLPQVDVAAHTEGQTSRAYRRSLRLVGQVWERVVSRLPMTWAAIGTSDHGHVDVPPGRQVEIPRGAERHLTFYGDSRCVFVRGNRDLAARLAEELPATWFPREEVSGWWGPGPLHPRFRERAPDGLLAPLPGYMLLHRFSDRRLVGSHGGMTEEELRIPLLVASPGGASD